jgi:hypothetical protein
MSSQFILFRGWIGITTGPEKWEEEEFFAFLRKNRRFLDLRTGSLVT